MQLIILAPIFMKFLNFSSKHQSVKMPWPKYTTDCMSTATALNRACYLHHILLHHTWFIENFSELNEEYHYLRRLLAYRGIHNIYVASHRAPSTLGVPYHINHVNYGHFRLLLRRCTLDALCLKHIILFVDVTSFNDAVMSYMMSQCHTCIGHMTIYYKRATNTLVGRVSVSSSVH